MRTGKAVEHIEESGAERRPALAMSQQAYELLKLRITTGVLAGGMEIDDEAVAAEIGSSRTPVREALLRLASERFVEIVPRHAIRVIPVSLADMAHMYELLTALEVFAVDLATRRRPSRAELSGLRAAVSDMRRQIKAADRTQWIDADERFHRGLLTLSGNPHIAEVGIGYRDRVLRVHVVALRLRPQPAQSIAAHAELVELIAAGDADVASRRHREQRDRAGKELLASLERSGLQQF